LISSFAGKESPVSCLHGLYFLCLVMILLGRSEELVSFRSRPFLYSKKEIKSQPSFPGWTLRSAQPVGVADWFAAAVVPSPVYLFCSHIMFLSAPCSWGERAASICKFVW